MARINLIDETFDKQNFLDFCHSESTLAGEESHRFEQQEPYKGKDQAKTEAILDYRKSCKLIDSLIKVKL